LGIEVFEHSGRVVLPDPGVQDPQRQHRVLVEALAQQLRRRILTAPILVLSARHAQQQKVAALDAGADDYVAKPFGMDELLARAAARTPSGIHTGAAGPASW
jgi:CheY-like chemotaxis protein